MSYLTVYLIVMLDSISCALNVLFWGPIIMLIGMWTLAFFNDCINDEEVFPKIKKATKILIIISAISFLPCTFVPNTKGMAIIYVTPKLINSVNDSKIPQALIGLANAWIEELKPEKDGEKTH